MKRLLTASAAIGCCALALLGGVTGCDNQNPETAASDPAPPTVPSPAPLTGIPGDKPVEGSGRTVTIYQTVEDAGGNRSLKAETVPLPAGAVSSPATFALESLMNAAKSPIPTGTKLRSVKIGADGVATVDLSGEFKANFKGGDSGEAVVLNALISTLGQFDSVKSVQILVDGKKIDSLGGNQALDEPLPVQAVATEGDAPKGGG